MTIEDGDGAIELNSGDIEVEIGFTVDEGVSIESEPLTGGAVTITFENGAIEVTND